MTLLLDPSNTLPNTEIVAFSAPPEIPALAFPWKDRLCWVHRRGGDNTYLWPAIYFKDWDEAYQRCINELSANQRVEYGFKLYESYGRPYGAVVKLLGLDTLELQEISEQGEEKEEDNFCGEFWGWFARISSKQIKMSAFQDNREWYLPFMKAIDQSMSIIKGETCDKMFRLGQQQIDAAAALGLPEQNSIASPQTNDSPPEQSSDKADTNNSRSHKNSMKSPPAQSSNKEDSNHSLVSPESDSSPSFCEDTPTRANTTMSKTSEANRELFTPSKRAAAKSKIRSVTPSRISSRTKRKPKKDLVSMSLSRWSKTAKSQGADDDFYSFNKLMPFLVSKLNWIYRPATDSLRTWVYERQKDGERRGKHLEDFFYEESEVIEYCRRNDYEAKYGQMMKDYEEEEKNVVTPPSNKRMRKEEVTN